MAQALVSEFDVPSAPLAAQATPEFDHVTLAIEGLHCGVCMRTVETALRAVPGVVEARVNLSNKRATVQTTRRAVPVDALIEALDRAGFKAAELTSAVREREFDANQDLLRRLGVAGFAAMNIMLLSVSVWSGAGADMDRSVQSLFHWLSAVIALPAVAYAGQPFFRSAVLALKAHRLNMDVPISLGVCLATAMSVYQTARVSEQVYFDAAVTLLAFLLLGRLLDQQMRTRASGAAANLLGLKASSVSVLDDADSVTRIPLKAIEPGMRVLASAGERISIDGIVASGESDIDQSLITGESMPKRVAVGDAVYAGTINLSNPIVVKATRHDENSLLADIARLMATAEQGRGKYVRLADRAARIYAPAVHVLGLATFAGWMIAGHAWQEALTAAIAVLIVTCPCALALAVPAVQVAAASRLFGRGIILKAADGLERLAEVDTIVFDKTGTLTSGEPRLCNRPAITTEALTSAARMAVMSRHPYSRAIVKAARDDGIEVYPDTTVTETAGFGLARTTSDGEERLGSASWCGLQPSSFSDCSELWFKPARGPAIPFLFADAIREDASAVISALKAASFNVELLSGDGTQPVSEVAQAAGITRWLAEQRPDQKIARLEALAADGHKVLMVGDGLNDAPALMAAYASISPSSAADISQTAADAIFQGSRLQPVIEILAVAKAARSMSLQNFALAVAYNVIFVPLAMAGLVTPLIAAVAMSASSVSVTANALRLRSKTLGL